MQLDLTTGRPTGGIIASGWTDPLRTPQRYIEVPQDEYDQPIWGKCVINIAKWMTAIRNANTEWTKRLYEVGAFQYKNKFDPRSAHMDGFLLDLAGPKPWPSEDCLEALRTGNRHLAGQVLGPDGLAILDEEAQELMDHRNTNLHPKALDENEFNIVQARRGDIKGLPEVDATMAPEAAPTVTGTSREDYLAFQAQGIAAGMTQPEVLLAWKEHKEMLKEAETAEV
jgi:hypothetical protein